MSGRIYPVNCKWTEVEITDADGISSRLMAMVPTPRYAKLAERQYHPGEEYPLVPLEARSRASHSHYFAALTDGFHNLPESVAARWPSADHLRKWLLVETGWFNESEIDCASPATARQTAVLMRSFDDYARISVHGSKVIIRRAKSQSASSMGKDAFEKSKKDVLNLLEEIIGSGRGSLMRQAGRSA